MLRAGSLQISGEAGTIAVEVELADTPENRGQGLMCRAEVPAGTGMVFLWSEPISAGFWMFNTYVPLDILYVGPDAHVVAARTMAPCPRAAPEQHAEWTARCAAESSAYAAGTDYRMAVELPAGWLESQGFAMAASLDWRVALRD
jgi:uncharacterized membrane protein (UPF0127 family)